MSSHAEFDLIEPDLVLPINFAAPTHTPDHNSAVALLPATPVRSYWWMNRYGLPPAPARRRPMITKIKVRQPPSS